MNEETLVPLDLSDAIAMIDRQKQRIDELTTWRDRLREELEKLDSPYCPTCGACGEEGCCPPDRCKHLICFYGEHYVRTYRDLEAENKRLRQIVIDCHDGWPDEVLQEALRGEGG